MEVFMKKKILVVIDNSDVCQILSFNLESEGHDVGMAFSAEEAFQKLTSEYHLIMIDIMTGNKRDFDFIKKLHEESGIPVIFLADLKPFIFRDLLDHVKAVLKIEKSDGSADGFAESLIKIGRLCIDPSSKRVKIGDSTIPLTKREYEILHMLASNPLKPYSRRQIIKALWKNDGGSVTDQAVDAHIIRLRKKLGHDSCCIFYHHGFGYEFDPSILLSAPATPQPD
jgi:DNA-binding response OmpR family regulator